MKRIFGCELIIGVIGFCLVMLLGVKGISIVTLCAVLPFLKQKDKNEFSDKKLLFYKINIVAFVAVMFLLLLLFFIQDCSVFTNTSLFVKDIWFYLSIFFLLFVHGLSGLILFVSKEDKQIINS
jgi:hypothetical protein